MHCISGQTNYSVLILRQTGLESGPETRSKESVSRFSPGLGTELVDVDRIVQHHRVSRFHIALHLHRETVNLLPEQCQSTLLVWVNVIFAMS